MVKTLIQPGDSPHCKQPLNIEAVQRAFGNDVEQARLMAVLQRQVKTTCNIIRSQLKRWTKEQQLDMLLRLQGSIAIPLEAPIALTPRAWEHKVKLDMRRETEPGGRFFCHSSVYQQPETRHITNFTNLTLVIAATEILEMAEKEAQITQELSVAPQYLSLGGRCWPNMPEGDRPHEERVRISQPLQQSSGFLSMAVALRASVTTDQAVDCGRRHVNCSTCAGCRRHVLCPVQCRICGFVLETLVARFKDDDEAITETMAEMHDRLYHQSVYLQAAPGGFLVGYPYQRNPTDIADRLPTRIRWKNLVVSTNDVEYFNSVAQCERCPRTHNYLRPKAKPMPFLMGSASYKDRNDSEPPQHVPMYARMCPEDKPIEQHLREADEFSGKEVGYGAAEETYPRIIREAALTRPTRFNQIVRQRVPEDFSTGCSRPLDEPQDVLDVFINTTKQPMGGASDPARVFNTSEPIGEEEVATPHFVHTRNCGSITVGWRKELQQTIHDSIYHVI